MELVVYIFLGAFVVVMGLGLLALPVLLLLFVCEVLRDSWRDSRQSDLPAPAKPTRAVRRRRLREAA